MSAATTPKAARAGANPRAAGANASNPRRVAFDVLRQVTGEDAYANLALAKRLAVSGLDARDAGLVTELVSGTCRLMGTYDRVIEEASGRALGRPARWPRLPARTLRAACRDRPSSG